MGQSRFVLSFVVLRDMRGLTQTQEAFVNVLGLMEQRASSDPQKPLTETLVDELLFLVKVSSFCVLV